MARYKAIDTSPRFLVVDLEKQLLPGSFEHAVRGGPAQLDRISGLLGHSDVSTTMIYTHVLNRGGRGVVSPLDAVR